MPRRNMATGLHRVVGTRGAWENHENFLLIEIECISFFLSFFLSFFCKQEGLVACVTTGFTSLVSLTPVEHAYVPPSYFTGAYTCEGTEGNLNECIIAADRGVDEFSMNKVAIVACSSTIETDMILRGLSARFVSFFPYFFGPWHRSL
jgi:hypothetical protein